MSKAAQGIRLRAFLHADQIPGANGATPTSWPNVGDFLNSSQAAFPTIDTSGFNSLRSLNCASSKYLQCDALAQYFNAANSNHALIMACKIPAAGGILNVTSTTDAAQGWYLYTAGSVVALFLDPQSASATSQTTSSIAAQVGVPAIIGFSRRNAVWTLKILTSAGETAYKADTAFVKAGTLSLQRAAIGAEPTAGAASGYGNFWNEDIRCVAYFNNGNDTITSNLVTDLMVHMRDKLGCPL